jgi:hypothetical protein
LKKEDVRMGMKVIPFQKTAVGWEEDIEEYKNHTYNYGYFLRENGYLYATEYDEYEEAWVLTDDLNERDGDYFNAEDFEPYEQYSLKEKLLKLQKLYNEMMELQYEINGEFNNKLISISNILGSWSDGRENLRINRVDIRTDDIGILFDIYEDGGKIECVDGLEFSQFIENGELL